MPDPLEYYGNLIEACFWCTLGVSFAISACWRRWRTHKVLAAATLLIFGGSDYVEAHTGQWWDPWWLLAWKLACIGVLAVLAVTYLRVYYRQQREKQQAAMAK